MQNTKITGDATSSLAQTVTDLTEKAIMEAAENASEAIFVSCCSMIAAMAVGAAFLGKTNDNLPADEAMKKATSKESLLLMALVAGASFTKGGCSEHGEDCSHLGVNYGPPAIIKAMDWYERITGEKPDQYLDEKLVQAMQRYTDKFGAVQTGPENTFTENRPKLHS